MASIVARKPFSAVLRSKTNTGAGTIFVVAEEVTSNKEYAKLQFAAKKLDKKDFFGKSDPFMVISRSSLMVNGHVTNTVVHRTNVVKNNLEPC